MLNFRTEQNDEYWENYRAIENKDTQYDIQYLFIKYYSSKRIDSLSYYSSKRIDSLSFENHLDNLIKNIETLIGRIARKEPLKEDIIRPFIFKEIIGNYSYKIKSIFKQHLINPLTYSDSIFRQKEYGAQYYDWHRFEAEIQGKILAIKNADNFAEIADKLTEATDIFKTFSEQVFPVESDCMANCTGFFDNLIFYSEKNHLKEILRKIKSELDNLIDSFEMIIKKLGITLEIPSKVVFPRLS